MTPTLESIWTDFAERLGSFIRSRVNDPFAAQDIRQEVFAKIQKRLGSLRDFRKLESWIYQLARHTIIDYYRTRREDSEWVDSLPAEPPMRDQETEALVSSFRRMIDDLPAPYREAIVLTELEGLTQAELAARLGISLSGAKSRVQRARDRLRARLLECCRFEFDRRGGVIECEPRKRTSCPECSGGATPRPPAATKRTRRVQPDPLLNTCPTI